MAGIPIGLCLVLGVLVGAGCLIMPEKLIMPTGAALLTFSAVLFAAIGDYGVYLRVGAFLLTAVPGWAFRTSYDAIWLLLNDSDDEDSDRALNAIKPDRGPQDRPQAWRVPGYLLINAVLRGIVDKRSPRGYDWQRWFLDEDNPQHEQAAQPPAPGDPDGHARAPEVNGADDVPRHRQQEDDPDPPQHVAQPGGRGGDLPENVLFPAEDDREFAHDGLPDGGNDAGARDLPGHRDAGPPDRPGAEQGPPALNDELYEADDATGDQEDAVPDRFLEDDPDRR
jgi:hypothetical protein